MFGKRGVLLLVLLAFVLINTQSINSGWCPGICGCADSQSCYNYYYDSYYGYICGTSAVSCGTDGCSGGQWVDYYCASSYCYSQYLERDASSTYCACLGANHWSIGGEVAATDCCGDDSGEYKLTRNCNSGCTSDTNDDACCSNSGNCVYDSACYDSGSCNPGNVFCSSGNWYDSDANSVYCESCVGSNRWYIGGEVAATDCCGDDANEYYTSRGIGPPACCQQQGDNICVTSAVNCRNEYNKEVSCYDSLDNDCDGNKDCTDTDCKIGTETNLVDEIDVGCRDKIDNDCDGLTDCSDPDCYMSLDCIGCDSEVIEMNCEDGIDNDCDEYVDCVPGNADSDCVNMGQCEGCTTEVCNNDLDDNCNGLTDCDDGACFDDSNCIGQDCVAENTEALCGDGLDNDCDGLIDNLDRNCPGCGMGKKLCSDGSCKETCGTVQPQGCVGSANGVCEEGEGCSCEDCFGKTDSCERELVCDPNDQTCKCPSGTTMCADGRCRTKCFVCGDNILEEGEECDGTIIAGGDACPEGCTGTVSGCNEDCTIDASSCTCTPCDPDKNDDYCCVNPDDDTCDADCTANADPDCADKPCTSFLGDCCKDVRDDRCDPDCINYKDPDCSTSCSKAKDDCCNSASDGTCDPDCDYNSITNVFVDPDCSSEFPEGCTNNEGDCCNDLNDNVCDLDCIIGVDSDCKCGNKIIDSGETCDTVNFGGKTCGSIFGAEYGGMLACFNINGENPCHLDTSGCYKIPEICTGGSCSIGKDCRCSECLGQQAICSYGSVCDSTAKCACIDGTTLCKDSTCMIPQNCGEEQLCITQNGICEPGEGCGCPDCEDKKGPCNQLSVCKDGVCTGCFLERAYWADVNTGEEENCIGSGNDIKLVVEGTQGCKDKTVTFKLEGEQDLGNSVFKDSKAELVWLASPEGIYEFESNLEGKSDRVKSTELEVEPCVKECDADCDNYCEEDSDYCINAKDPKGNPYCKLMDGGGIVLDANALSPWCEDCNPYGLAKGQESCAAYYDCTPGWWGDDGNYNGAGNAAEARAALEWGDCGDSKVDISQLGPPDDPDHGKRQIVIGTMRNRLVCPPGLSKQECCESQANCYCEYPDEIPPGMNCDLPEFRPTEIKACLAEEKFPFFTNMNILIVVLILTGFYIWKTRKD